MCRLRRRACTAEGGRRRRHPGAGGAGTCQRPSGSARTGQFSAGNEQVSAGSASVSPGSEHGEGAACNCKQPGQGGARRTGCKGRTVRGEQPEKMANWSERSLQATRDVCRQSRRGGVHYLRRAAAAAAPPLLLASRGLATDAWCACASLAALPLARLAAPAVVPPFCMGSSLWLCTPLL